jgi:uncharacterized caspase-like protein
VQGSNYLLPIDITPMYVDQERRLRSDAINLTDLLTDFQEHKARVTLVILDACRDNPFQAAQTVATRSLGSARGLTRVEPPRGTFVMFSAGVGQTALDNLGPDDHDPNGLFTRKLLSLINEEGLELHSMVLRLRKEVQVAALSADHEQFLGYYDQLNGEFYFHPPTSQSATPVRSPKSCGILGTRSTVPWTSIRLRNLSIASFIASRSST